MAINKLPEFAKDGQKNTDDLVLADGFPVLKKPARQWFNWLFNGLSLKTNEIIDEVDTKLSKSSNLSDLQSASAARTSLGLGNSAIRDVMSHPVDYGSGKVMTVGAFGLGQSSSSVYGNIGLNVSNFTADGTVEQLDRAQFITLNNDGAIGYPSGLYFPCGSKGHAVVGGNINENLYHICVLDYRVATPSSRVVKKSLVRTSANTTVDPNGFLKAASPVIQLFSDKIKLNSEAEQQSITFEKLGVGDYLIKGSTGLAQEGWYIEQPKDANGSVYHAVVYEQLENGDISVKTFEQKLEGTRIVADVEKPVDIKENRFISIRLNELPQDTTAPQNPNVVDSEGNPAPSKYHVLKDGIWAISDEDAEILAAEKYQVYLQSLKPLTRRQFKLALLENGLLDQIENSISAIEDSNMRARIQIEYTEATEFHRTSDSVAYMCQLLGLTDEQVNQMWESALTL